MDDVILYDGAKKKRQRQRRRFLLGYILPLASLLCGTALLWLWTQNLAASQLALPSVLLVPLDSRPVNTELPRHLAAIAGLRVALPENGGLDLFLTPSEPEQLYAWLAGQEDGGHDLTLIYLNTLLYGGLLNSRESAQYDQAAEKIEGLTEYLLHRRQSGGDSPVLAYIIPRLLPSQYDETMWAYEVELPELSQLKHRQALSPGDPELGVQIRSLEGRIPADIRKRYEQIYEEAYLTGLAMLDWLRLGLIREAVVGLDDSAEFGLNVKAFSDLRNAATERGEQNAWFLHGADELAPLIIARHSLRILSLGRPEDFVLCRNLTQAGLNQAGSDQAVADEAGADAIFPYEAIPLSANFAEKVAYLYDRRPGDPHGQSNGSANAGAAAGNSGKPKYVYLFAERETTAVEIREAWRILRADRTRPAGALVGLVDAARVNGAWPPLIESIGPDRVRRFIDSYAGWNTAGNSLGTVMAQLLFWEAAQDLRGAQRKAAEVNQREFMRLRLIDDYFFQTRIRQEAIDWTVSEGFPYLFFGERWPEANAKLQELMTRALAPWPELRSGKPYHFSFPWPRSFEIRIESPNFILP